VGTITQELARFAAETRFEDLPASIVAEIKKVLMEHVGVGLAALTTDKGKLEAALGRRLGGPPEASIIGLGDKVSVTSAVLANGELMITLDYHDNMSYGHDGLFVTPPALAMGESTGASGKDVILAMAVGLEISSRLARAAGWHTLTSEEVKKAIATPPKDKNGHSAYGAAAAAGRLLKLDTGKMMHALGIAGRHVDMSLSSGGMHPTMKTMTKYVLPGWQNTGSVISALLAQMGYLGDLTVMDDPKRLGWDPTHITEGLGQTWVFNQQLHYKPYPCCGAFHHNLDCFYKVIEENNLKPDEIEKVTIFGRWAMPSPPKGAKKVIEGIYAAQFNQPYNFSLLAHRVRRGVEWVDPDTMKNPAILDFMDKVGFVADPAFAKVAEEARIADPRMRPAKVEVAARGKTFTGEIRFRLGDTFTDGVWTQQQAIEKYQHNAERILIKDKIEKSTEYILGLEKLDKISQLMEQITL
jgi:2-methylcitrate dehydratase PrpD